MGAIDNLLLSNEVLKFLHNCCVLHLYKIVRYLSWDQAGKNSKERSPREESYQHKSSEVN